MSWAKNYGWLEHFWRDVVAERSGRRWVVATLFDGDLLLRDAFAYVQIRERIRDEHRDVRWAYVRAFSSAGGPSLAPEEDILFVGRPKPFANSGLALFANQLEGGARGRFIDPSNGTTGHTVRYGARVLSRHELDAPPEYFRRCDVDYGILLHRCERIGGETHRLVAISGLSTLGTLGLALILTDDTRRAQLVAQVRELAPWLPEHRPEESFEICVRIAVAGEEQLATILSRPEFTFRVEAVAIPPDEPRIRAADEAELVLLPEGDGRGGFVRVSGAAEVKLSRARFALLRLLAERPERAEADELCRELGFAESKAPVSDKARGLLAKLVHDLNVSLQGIPGLPHGRIVRHRRTDGRYALVGARGTVVTRPAPETAVRNGRRTPRRPRPRTASRPDVAPSTAPSD